MAERVTLKDVAREAGVHVSTASRALNPDTRSVVNARTAGRVLSVAKRLGYAPHPLARGLRTNRTLTVGMVLPDLMNPLFPPIHSGAAEALSEFGYSLLIGEARQGSEAEWVTAALMERRVDGLILATAELDHGPPEALAQRAVPTVLVNRTSDSWGLPSIVGDDHAGIGHVVRHLAGLGHRRIAHVAGPHEMSTGLARRQAFAAWMNSEGLAVDFDLIIEAKSFKIEAGHRACDQLLSRGAEFTAIVAANDLIALGCMDSLGIHRLGIPGDVSLTGYNDTMFVDRVDPPLTTVAVEYRAMGAGAAKVLLELLADDGARNMPATSTRLATRLVVRASTAAPRHPSPS